MTRVRSPFVSITLIVLPNVGRLIGRGISCMLECLNLLIICGLVTYFSGGALLRRNLVLVRRCPDVNRCLSTELALILVSSVPTLAISPVFVAVAPSLLVSLRREIRHIFECRYRLTYLTYPVVTWPA